VVAVVGPTVAATPGERMVTIHLTFDAADEANQTFTASGRGFCPSGRADDQAIEYIAFGETFKIRLTKWLRCDDGSGDIQILLSAGEPTDSPTRSGGWVVIGGTGDYEGAVGGGTISSKPRYPKDTLGVDTMTGTITR
jgi:hypothetical protein